MWGSTLKLRITIQIDISFDCVFLKKKPVINQAVNFLI